MARAESMSATIADDSAAIAVAVEDGVPSDLLPVTPPYLLKCSTHRRQRQSSLRFNGPLF
jgi:hypothetical protein